MSSPRQSSNRWIRYGSPVALIIVSVLVAAVEVNQVGNDIQVAGTAIGLVWLIATIGRDMGMGTKSGHRSRVPDPPAAPGYRGGPEAPQIGSHPEGPATSARRAGPPRADDAQPPVSPS